MTLKTFVKLSKQLWDNNRGNKAEWRCNIDPHYLPQLLLLLQPDCLCWIGNLDLVVVAGTDSGLGDLDRTLQIGLPYTIHVPGANAHT